MSDTELLPTVQWGGHRITRMLLGHNPMKGGSHYSPELSAEMRSYHEDVAVKVAAIERAVACGVNTVQFGGEVMHQALDAYAARGGRIQWIATHYGNTQGKLGVGARQSFDEELGRIQAVRQELIGVQHFGECTDQLYVDGHADEIRERLKRLRDTGLLVGLCTHLPEVIELAEEQEWDCDFYQTCFYTVYSAARMGRIDRGNESFAAEDRARMVALIQRVAKPCLAFKVLAARRRCDSPEAVREALREAYADIKPEDVVLLGMWQKHGDQIGQNSAWVREILASSPAARG